MKKINVLLIEDSENDAVLIKRELQKDGFEINMKRVETEDSMKRAIKEKEWDIVISDYILPKFGGKQALQIIRDSDLEIPFIIVSGKIGEDTAVDAMKHGADDYIMKDNLKKLTPAIKRELRDYETKREEKKAKEEIEKYHNKLETINKQLKNEISERKEAEKNAIEAKEYLQNVIDSTSKIIISVNNNGRITIWNNQAEQTTGFKESDVSNRTMSKLSAIHNPQQITDTIKDIQKGKKTTIDCVILTKDNAKKIIRLNGSLLRGKGNEKMGVIFIGEDITRDAEMHGKLLEGNSYLVAEKQIDSAIDLFTDLIKKNHPGLFITRMNPDTIKSMIPQSKHIQIRFLADENFTDYTTISNLKTFVKTIKDHSTQSNNSIILIDSTHYLLTKFGFNEFINTLYQINEIIIKTKSMLFIRFDPAMLSKTQMAIIENELRTLPSQRIKGITLEDSVYHILKFVYQQNQNNALVPFKKVMSKFNISYSTAAKRLESLEEKDLIFTKRKGKLRAIYISEKGKTLLHKRDIAE